MTALQLVNQLSKDMALIVSAGFATIFFYAIVTYFVVGVATLIINIIDIFFGKHDDDIRDDDK